MLENWKINISKQADKFSVVQKINDDFIKERISLCLRKFNGENVSVKVKKLNGKWEGYYRIRVGKIRIICTFDFGSKIASVEVIDFRGNVYK